MKCRDRILHALRFQHKTPAQLHYELFVDRTTIADYLARLIAEGVVFKRFRPHPVTAAPEYTYSSVRYTPRYCPSKYKPVDYLDQSVGNWDAVDMRSVKR